jgi:predicted nucleotidyltransferase
MTDRSQHLRAVAERVAKAYLAHTAPRAILLTGSAADGGTDHHSDVDLIAYYDVAPPDEQLQQVRRAAGAERIDGRKFWVAGVEVDGGAATVADCERHLGDVLERFEARSLAQRWCEGILRGVPLHGAELIEGWQARARAYPPQLARAMVEAHLSFWPIWSVADWLLARDMLLWHQQTLVDSSHNILGVLAGVNRLYFHPAFFKRLGPFVGRMRAAPPGLAERLVGLFAAEPSAAIAALEGLVAETVAIVETEMPEVDTSRVRKDLGVRRPTSAAPSAEEAEL